MLWHEKVRLYLRRNGMTQDDLAESLGVSRTAVGHYLAGRRSLKYDQMVKIAALLRLRVEDLVRESAVDQNLEDVDDLDVWDENTPLRPDEVALPFFREVELAAGAGRYEVIENHGHKLRFSRATLKRAGVVPENAYCARVSGNSMEPVLPDGAAVGIDTGSTRIRDGEMYAINHDGLLRIKILHLLPGGTIRVRSINSDEWPEETYSGQALEHITILGRVFWWSVLRVSSRH